VLSPRDPLGKDLRESLETGGGRTEEGKWQLLETLGRGAEILRCELEILKALLEKRF
jgi:hypothetical protein